LQVFQEHDLIKKRYKILSLIGKGGIGTTYRAQDTKEERVVVVKTLDFQDVKDWKEVELFEREIFVLKKIDHPFIPNYYDNFKLIWNNKTLYTLVMEYIEGENLYEIVKKGGRLSITEDKKILKKLCRILSYIHNISPPVIHRDINPKNIIRTPAADIFLVDFGAAGRVVADTLAASTSDTFVGTIGYMPPEQLYGKSLPSSDMYSLGVTMLYILTGKEPAEFRIREMRLDYSNVITLPHDLKKCIDRMIEPALEKRVQDADDILRILEKERIKKEKQEKEAKDMAGEIPFVPDIDHIVEVKRRKEHEKRRRKEEKKRLGKKRKKEKERLEKEKADASPRRVYTYTTDEGVMLSVKEIPFFTLLKNKLKLIVITSLLFMVFVSLFILAFYEDVLQPVIFPVSFPSLYGTTITAATFFLIIVIVRLFIMNVKKLKSFTILITKKNNVLIFKKDPLKPLYTGRKNQLKIRIDKTGSAPGGFGESTIAWKNIFFTLSKNTLMDHGFKTSDADRIIGFCKKHGVACTND
jgi:serine/threonine protein kinase